MPKGKASSKIKQLFGKKGAAKKMGAKAKSPWSLFGGKGDSPMGKTIDKLSGIGSVAGSVAKKAGRKAKQARKMYTA